MYFFFKKKTLIIIDKLKVDQDIFVSVAMFRLSDRRKNDHLQVSV